jgi:predicted transcriptional regulator
MRRTTVKLPDELDARLRHEAALRGVSISEVTREALQEHLDVRERRKLHSIGAGRSGRTDISERIEEILREELHP